MENRVARCTVSLTPPCTSRTVFAGKTAMAVLPRLLDNRRSAAGSRLLFAFRGCLPTCEGPALAVAGPTFRDSLRQAASAKTGLVRPRLAA